MYCILHILHTIHTTYVYSFKCALQPFSDFPVVAEQIMLYSILIYIISFDGTIQYVCVRFKCVLLPSAFDLAISVDVACLHSDWR